MKKRYILFSLVFLAQLTIVAQDGNTKKQTNPKKEMVSPEGKRITSEDKIAEYEALKKVQLSSKSETSKAKVETVVLKKGKTNAKREVISAKVESDSK